MTKSEVSRNELGMMILAYAYHFPRRISSMCNLSTVVKANKRKLTKRQQHLFKKDIFGFFWSAEAFRLVV